ncbi:MAG: hypothetical protein K9K62_03165 [Desulfobacteraceae bacterium]|nr:hypothetical protein [Desulfobacteraceae bacterium]
MPEKETAISKHVLDTIGGGVDSLFLAVPRLLKHFRPARQADRQTREQEADFYFDHGYTHRPETFFTLPATCPDYRVVEEKPYPGGTYQLIAYPSGYAPQNPLIREYFGSFPANRTGYLARWTHGDPGRKTVLCLHGYMLGEPLQAHRMFKMRKLFEMGLDTALFIAPFHWRRAPENRSLRGIFLQPDDVAMTCECFGQAMHDLELTQNILADLGAGKNGIVGASLGGYFAGLYAALSDRAAFSAMMVPAVNLQRPFGPDSVDLPFEADPELVEKLSTVWQLHSPLNFTPKISAEKMLIIASRGDRICPFAPVYALWEKWGRPSHRFMTGGHWLAFNAKARGAAWYGFLKEQGFA